MVGQNALPLRDIHLPDPVSWWPPAFGWWLIVAAIITSALVYFFIKTVRKKRLLRKTILEQLDMIYDQFKTDNNKTILAQSLSILMRRSCISFYPRANTAGLTGAQWLHYLDNTTDKKGFTNGDGQILATAPYLPAHNEASFDANKLISLCKTWLLAQPCKNIAENIPAAGGQP